MLLTAFNGIAQERDHFSLFTDRDLYVSGETILFKLFAPEDEQSGIVKVNLVNIGGIIISEVNKKITAHQADGFIYLPDSLKTGSYLLSVSTKANKITTMKELLICNRFTGLSENTSVPVITGTRPVTENVTGIQLDGIEKKYKTRETVHITIHLSPELLSQIKDSLFVTATSHLVGYQPQTIIKRPSLPVNNSVPENGIIIEGTVKDMETGNPFNNGCIFLSIPDTIPDLHYYFTGADGRFNFQLDNCYGKIPVVVQGFDPEKKHVLKISLLHQDSLSQGIPNFESYSLPENLQKIISNQIESATLSKIFNYQELNISSPVIKKRDYPFYGVPTEVVRPALFVELPDFTEISRELLQGVKFRAYNRIPTLQILNPATLNFYNDEPMVLLDGIPVQDLNVIKNMGSADISRIEICRKERFYGDLSFQGVIAIYSTKQDYQRLPESNDLIKFYLDAIQPDAALNIPTKLPSNEPDLRKVLLWKPTIKPVETIQLNFETSDIRGSYQLMVRGKTKDGIVISQTQNFEVY